MHGKFCSYFEQIDTEDISLENQKTWNHTAGARRCRCRGEASDSSLCPGPNREVHRTRTGFTRLPVLDRPDYFGHDRGRGKYTERVCSTERREEAGGEERVESGLVECGSRSSREAYSIEREEVLLLRQNLQGSQHAAKREVKIRTRCIQFHRAICH